MSVNKITTNITYRVPIGHYCNLVAPGTLTQHTTNMCRFAIKEKHGYRCALYNDVLEMENDKQPCKSEACVRALCGFKSVVEDVPDASTPGPTVDPKDLMKMTIDEYAKTVKQLKAQGYPDAIAEKVAKQYMLGGN